MTVFCTNGTAVVSPQKVIGLLPSYTRPFHAVCTSQLFAWISSRCFSFPYYQKHTGEVSLQLTAEAAAALDWPPSVLHILLYNFQYNSLLFVGSVFCICMWVLWCVYTCVPLTGFLNFSQVQLIGGAPENLHRISTFSPARIFMSSGNWRI